MTNIQLLKKIWEVVYDPTLDTLETIQNYFHPEYEQCINGIKLELSQYILHVIEQKKNILIQSIEYTHFLEKEDELFVIYFPKGNDKQNKAIDAEVIAYIEFKDQKIFRIYGQVRLIQGNLSDVDMS